MTNVLLMLNLVISFVNLLLLLAGPRKKAEAEPEAAESEKKEDDAGRLMDEGFDNLMRYSVGGKDGFS